MFLHLTHLLRTLRHHPTYSALNVLGLALALACSLLLYWLVRFHQSFDTYHPQPARIYRLVTDLTGGSRDYHPGIPTPTGPALRHDFPDLGTVAMSIGQEDQLVQVLGPGGQPGAKYAEPYAVAFVEPEYFSVFASYRWLVGTAAQALRQPSSVVLTQRLARQYFGTANPLGRRLRLNNQIDLTVTGLLADIPDNTDQRYGFFIAYSTLRQYQHSGTPLDVWEGVSSQTHGWVRLAAGRTPAQLERALLALHQAHHPTSLRTYRYQVLPLLEQHFAMEYDGTIAHRTLFILSCIGGLLLLTAGVNFVNLATAQALGRGREIGVRRTVGATSRRIFWQFMAETLLLVLLAAGTGLVLAYAALPGLRQWTNTPIPHWLDGRAWLFLAGLVLLLTLGAGWYPGRVLAGFRPAQVLKGQTPGQAGGLWVRRGLVVAQLVLSQGFTLGVLVMYQQLSVWLDTNPGFVTAGRVVLPTPWLAGADQMRLRADLLRVPGVANVTFGFDSPAVGTTNTSYFSYDRRARNEKFDVTRLAIDDHYLAVFGLQLVAGQALTTPQAPQSFLLNETAARLLGVGPPSAVIGHELGLNSRSDDVAYGPIVGVVRDWRLQGLEAEAIPMVLFHNPSEYRSITVQLAPGAALPPAVRTTWERYFPRHLFTPFRLDERVASFYEREQAQLAIVRLAALTAIAIGCLGLYGLVAFIAQRRAREIGIRKVFGARPWQIMASFVGEFAGLLAVAFVVAAPLTGWLMQRWLEQFATHISLQPWLFGVGLAGTATLTLLTIGYRTLRAALAPAAPALRAK
jgi:putative ABC transport system permease protein